MFAIGAAVEAVINHDGKFLCVRLAGVEGSAGRRRNRLGLSHLLSAELDSSCSIHHQ
jgi:hypothetical protein